MRKELEILNAEVDKVCSLEQKIRDFGVELKSKSMKLNFAMGQVKKWERIVSDVNKEKDSMEAKLEQLTDSNSKLAEEVNQYIDNYQSAKNDLKTERQKAESVVGQWRYLRHKNKANEKQKKEISRQISDHLQFPNITADQLKELMVKIKRKLSDEEESEEDEEDEQVVVSTKHDENVQPAKVKVASPVRRSALTVRREFY